jgi:hypothetical protein
MYVLFHFLLPSFKIGICIIFIYSFFFFFFFLSSCCAFDNNTIPLSILYGAIFSFCSDIRNWIRNIEQHASDNVNKILVGNKADMDESKRVGVL